ncbi:hypothetical protein ACFE04_015447 [Oxalis oulophora]
MLLSFRKRRGYSLSNLNKLERKRKRKLADDLKWRDSPASANITKKIVIVYNGLKEFSIEPLIWTLENIASTGCIVTLVGAMPWLNISLLSKTWKDIWTVSFDELQENNELKACDVKYQKLQLVVDLCNKYGVIPQKEVVMGHPLRLLVAERIMSLEATWVVFDRHHRRNKEYYAEKLPCNMVIMNEDGDVDMIRSRSLIDHEEELTSDQSPALVPTPILLISKGLKQNLKEKVDDDELDDYIYVI